MVRLVAKQLQVRIALQFRDNDVTPRTEQAVHYYLNIHSVEPTFVPQSLKVPPDILPKLTAIH